MVLSCTKGYTCQTERLEVLSAIYDDIAAYNNFLHYRPFVRGIHRQPWVRNNISGICSSPSPITCCLVSRAQRPWKPASFLSGYYSPSSGYRATCSLLATWIFTLITPSSYVNSSPPVQNGRHFADDIWGRIFVKEKFVFRLKFHWSLFPRVQLTITQQWFR